MGDKICRGGVDEPGVGDEDMATRDGGAEDVQSGKAKVLQIRSNIKEGGDAASSHPTSPSAGAKVFKLQRGSKSFSSFPTSNAKSAALLAVIFAPRVHPPCR